MTRSADLQYQELLAEILEHGDPRLDRTGVGTKAVFGRLCRFDLAGGTVPILTTKRIYWKTAVKEMLWFLTGGTNLQPLLRENVRIWTDWPLARFREVTGEAIAQADFERRMKPGLTYCQRVGNVMGATAMLSLASTIANGDFDKPQRIGVFSYGSGCCSEFFSGVATKQGQERLRSMHMKEQLDSRYELSMDEYDELLVGSNALKFGTRNVVLDSDFIPRARKTHGKPTLFLKEIREYQRKYEWVQ